MAITQFPAANAPTEQQKWVRAVQKALNDAERIGDDTKNRVENLASASNGKQVRIQDEVATLQETVTTLQATVSSLQDVTTKLTAAGQVAVATLGKTVSNFSGFYTGSRPTVNVSSPTGRIEVLFGGSLNSGNGTFVISVTDATTGASYKSRNTMRANYDERLALSGGASFIGSGYTSVIVSVPVNTTVTVTLELYADSANFVYFFGGKIQVSASL